MISFHWANSTIACFCCGFSTGNWSSTLAALMSAVISSKVHLLAVFIHTSSTPRTHVLQYCLLLTGCSPGWTLSLYTQVWMTMRMYKLVWTSQCYVFSFLWLTMHVIDPVLPFKRSITLVATQRLQIFQILWEGQQRRLPRANSKTASCCGFSTRNWSSKLPAQSNRVWLFSLQLQILANSPCNSGSMSLRGLNAFGYVLCPVGNHHSTFLLSKWVAFVAHFTMYTCS